MKIPFEQLDVWKKACKLSVSIYKVFDKVKDNGLYSQITRAAVSVPSNIAEGSERQSKKEFIQFLYIAKGSVAELRTQLFIAGKLNKIKSEEMNKLVTEAIEVSRMLQAMITGLKKSNQN